MLENRFDAQVPVKIEEILREGVLDNQHGFMTVMDVAGLRSMHDIPSSAQTPAKGAHSASHAQSTHGAAAAVAAHGSARRGSDSDGVESPVQAARRSALEV